MPSLFHFLVRLGHLVTAVHQKDLLTYFVISKRFATDTSPSFFLFIFIFCVYIAWSLLREFRYLPREPGNISSFFMVFCFIVEGHGWLMTRFAQIGSAMRYTLWPMLVYEFVKFSPPFYLFFSILWVIPSRIQSLSEDCYKESIFSNEQLIA